MDAGYIDDKGYVYVLARDDDVINVAGHRISTSAMEEAICEHGDVAEAAVVGIPDALKGQVPLCFYVIKNGKLLRNWTWNGDLYCTQTSF